MRKGKMCSQSAHASMAAVLPEFKPNSSRVVLAVRIFAKILFSKDIFEWLSDKFTKICVSVDSEEELLEVYRKAKEANLHCSLIKDAGLTEFGGTPTYTAVAVGPGKPEAIGPITGHLKLL